MLKFRFNELLMATGLATSLLLTTNGCSNLPGTHGEQGAAIGGVGGAVAGAAIGGEHHLLLGALLGGAAGAGGGYLIGANSERITGHDTTGAQDAVRRAQEHPANPAEALSAPTADLNGDGFVTMDEVVAMKQAGLSDQQMLQKLQATGQVFELTPQQQDYLRQNSVDQYMIDQMPLINRDVRERLMTQPNGAPNTYQGAPAGTVPPYPSPNAPVPPPPGP
jgi:hypothetical protein